VSADDEDPLRAWREYAAWLSEAYAAGGEGGGAPQLVDVLERCTRAVKADARLFARLRNDPDYVKIWIAYVRATGSARAALRGAERRDAVAALTRRRHGVPPWRNCAMRAFL
jgi:hypothetical protein